MKMASKLVKVANTAALVASVGSTKTGDGSLSGRGLSGLPEFGLPEFGLPEFGLPEFGFPEFGLPVEGLSSPSTISGILIEQQATREPALPHVPKLNYSEAHKYFFAAKSSSQLKLTVELIHKSM